MKGNSTVPIIPVLSPIAGRRQYKGAANDAVSFIEETQIHDRFLWSRFVDQFREQLDGNDRGWRGEFWGKMMRGAVTVYQYSRSESLFEVLTESVRDMLSVAESDGRVSSFSRDTEFNAWDLWCRKYVMLGMEYYLEICRDTVLKQQIVTFLCGCADYIIERIGEEEGKLSITQTSGNWRAINSASILEPMVGLYRLTGKRSYFDFASYIVEIGAADGINLFELAYENKLYPYQYGVSKAYEMISCFEGLIAFYEITGVEKYRTAAIHFGKAVIDSDVTVIGTCGCTHELFDHSKVRQTAFYDGIMQETCVTVTWMKFCARLLCLTGERIFADQIEQSFYNAYLGALNTERCYCPYVEERFIARLGYPRVEYTFLPFDSYSPLRPGYRGQKTGGSQIFSDYRYYGCCACIASAGVGTFLKHAVMRDSEGIVVNFFEEGSVELDYRGSRVLLELETAYPADGKLVCRLTCGEPLDFALKIRLPQWSEQTKIYASRSHCVRDGYAVLSGSWQGTEEITVDLDMRIRLTKPIPWEKDVVYTSTRPLKLGYYEADSMEVTHCEADDHFVSLARGPLTLAADSRMGKAADSVFSFRCDENGNVNCRVSESKEIISGTPCLLNCAFLSEQGEEFHLVDYASAGRDWKTMIAAWLPTN